MVLKKKTTPKKRVRKPSKPATKSQVLEWLRAGVYTVDGTRIYKGDVELVQRINKRRTSHNGDARVDLYHEGCRISMHVSHLVWMSNTNQVLPKGFEIHHDDEDCTNNQWYNLICVHPLDHNKLHRTSWSIPDDDIPF